jgi:APA family basic amino acid/polyamine antiporter/amino acid efflux transporter
MKTLKKTIGKKTLIILTVNAIIGTGIFFLPALGAQYAGPASIISWILMSLIAVFISLYFAELVSMFPKSGGVYEYIKNAYGEFWAFIIGWTTWIVANITIAMLIVGALYYVFPSYGMEFYIISSLMIMFFFNFINYRGIELSTKMLLFFGVVTIGCLLALIIPGLGFVKPQNFEPFFVLPASGMILAIYFICETFFGWESTTFLAEEVKNSEKAMPGAIIISTVIIALLSLGVVFVCLGALGWQEFSVQKVPLHYAATQMFGPGFATVFAVATFVLIIGTAAGWIISTPRLLFAMSRDRVLPKGFQNIHGRHRTPYNAIIFQAVAGSVIIIAGLGNFQLLLSLLVPLVLVIYSFVMLSFMKLRQTMPKRKRYFRAPLGNSGPLLIILINFILVLIWLQEVREAIYILGMGTMLVVVGIPLYLIIKLQTDPKFVEKFFDRLSGIWDILFPVWYTRQDVKKVVDRLNLKQDAVVLDFGCGSGITTKEVAGRLSKKHGIVIAIDLSERQLESAIRKTKKQHNIIYMKESKIKFEKNSFDAVVAVGVLEHLRKPEENLKKISGCLKRGGTYSFLAFGRSFGMPAPEFLSSRKKIKKLFSKAGLKPNIRKETKKFTEYWYIYGKK